jgi:hypothetical protein
MNAYQLAQFTPQSGASLVAMVLCVIYACAVF